MGGVAAVATIIASAVSVGSTLTRKGPDAPPPPVTAPLPPDLNADAFNAAKAGQIAAQRQRSIAVAGGSRSGTLLTGPAGDASPTTVSYKTLLGQ